MRKKFGNGNLVGGQTKLDVAPPKGILNKADFKKLGSMNKKAGGGMIRQMYKKGKSVKKGYHKTKEKLDKTFAETDKVLKKLGDTINKNK